MIFSSLFFLPEHFFCVLASLSPSLLHAPHRRKKTNIKTIQNTTPLSSVTLWSWANAALPSPFCSVGGTWALMSHHDLWLAQARQKPPPVLAAAMAMHQLTGRTCSETDGVRERVGTVWDELHICRSQGIGPQPVRDYTVERRSQWESEFNFNLSDPWGKREMSGRPEKPASQTGQVVE